MEQIRYEFVLEARQPIAHHSETFGNTSICMRRKTRQPDGSFAHVPVITGDTMRHGMRESSSYALLDAAGLLSNTDLSEAALRLLFAGGMITGSAGGSVKLGDYRKMIELIPTLALFGGCAQNRAIPGRLVVDDAILICKESWHLLPEWIRQWLSDVQGKAQPELQSCRAHIEEAVRVRMDPTLDPGKRRLLSDGASQATENRLLLSEEASDRGDAITKDRAKSTMLPRSFERVVAGSLFAWSVTATCYEDLDVDTFNVTCSSFLSDARVGGKRGTGHGLLKAITARNLDVLRPSERVEDLNPGKLAPRMGTLFLNHMKDRSEDLKSFLAEVKA